MDEGFSWEGNYFKIYIKVICACIKEPETVAGGETGVLIGGIYSYIRRISFEINPNNKFLCNKIKIMNREVLSNTIYYKNLKCCTTTPCMTTETLSLMGNSLGHPLLDGRVDV